MKSSEEFKEGKHGIGYVSSIFNREFSDVEFDESSVLPIFQKLSRAMNDAAIEGKLKPGICTLGDVVAFLDAAPQECKDGYANLFYMPACVVRVYWDAGYGDWGVYAWERDGYGWDAGDRVFSPAIVA